jgi:hypothetical protein
LVNLAQHHLHYVHRSGIGHTHAANKTVRRCQVSSAVANLRAAAMHNDWIHADELSNTISCAKRCLSILVFHRMTAVLHDERFPENRWI